MPRRRSAYPGRARPLAGMAPPARLPPSGLLGTDSAPVGRRHVGRSAYYGRRVTCRAVPGCGARSQTRSAPGGGDIACDLYLVRNACVPGDLGAHSRRAHSRGSAGSWHCIAPSSFCSHQRWSWRFWSASRPCGRYSMPTTSLRTCCSSGSFSGSRCALRHGRSPAYARSLPTHDSSVRAWVWMTLRSRCAAVKKNVTATAKSERPLLFTRLDHDEPLTRGLDGIGETAPAREGGARRQSQDGGAHRGSTGLDRG